MMAVRLRNRMEMLGFTNQTLADKSGIPLATVNRIVAGQTENPNVQTLTALATALDITMDEIVGLMIRSETPVQPSPVVNMYENMTQTLQAVHRSGVQELKAAHADEIRRMEMRHREEIQALSAQHQKALEALDAKHFSVINRMENQYKDAGAAKDRWIARQFWLRIVMTGVIILVLVWALILELQNSDVGLIRW